RLREVLLLEKWRGERDQIAERLLVLTDAIACPRRLEQRFQPLLSAALDLVVVVDGVAILPVAVVSSRQLHEGELARVLVRTRLRFCFRAPRPSHSDHFFHRLEG